jgi:hypothetical protein
MRVDRRVAFVSLAVAVVVAVVVAGVVVATRPDHGTDTKALNEFLGLATRREKTTWLVTYRFDRRLGSGRTLTQSVTEGNRPPVHVLSGSGTVTVDFGDRIASCTATPKGPNCSEHKSTPSLAPAEVYRVATSLGGYRVVRGPTMTVAGEPATCFRLIAPKHKTTPTLGDETVQCYAADGVPLRSEFHHNGVVDTRTATKVTRKVSDAALNAILQKLDRERAAAGQ